MISLHNYKLNKLKGFAIYFEGNRRCIKEPFPYKRYIVWSRRPGASNRTSRPTVTGNVQQQYVVFTYTEPTQSRL
jgi:hypothetical protein